MDSTTNTNNKKPCEERERGVAPRGGDKDEPRMENMAMIFTNAASA